MTFHSKVVLWQHYSCLDLVFISTKLFHFYMQCRSPTEVALLRALCLRSEANLKDCPSTVESLQPVCSPTWPNLQGPYALVQCHSWRFEFSKGGSLDCVQMYLFGTHGPDIGGLLLPCLGCRDGVLALDCGCLLLRSLNHQANRAFMEPISWTIGRNRKQVSLRWEFLITVPAP